MPNRSEQAAEDGAAPRLPPCVPDRAVFPDRLRKLQVLSDIHFDSSACSAPTLAQGADAVVVAGDTCRGAEKAYAYLRASFPAPTPLLVVLGNHAFYGRSLLGELSIARRLARDYGVTLLEDDCVVLGGVRFTGSTMWTGYDLDGPASQVVAMAAAMRHVPDHRLISLTASPRRPFTPRQALERFERSSVRLARTLAQPFEGPTVVVTHHAPSERSLDPRSSGDVLRNADAGRLDALVGSGHAALWVHGHTHRSVDYVAGRTRVVCNAQGPDGENAAFDPGFVVRLGT